MPPVKQTNTGRQSVKRQFYGMVVGAAVGLAVLAAFPQLQKSFDSITLLILFAAAGSGLASLKQFEQAGAALTHKENPALNYAVGLGVPALFFILLAILIYFLKNR